MQLPSLTFSEYGHVNDVTISAGWVRTCPGQLTRPFVWNALDNETKMTRKTRHFVLLPLGVTYIFAVFVELLPHIANHWKESLHQIIEQYIYVTYINVLKSTPRYQLYFAIYSVNRIRHTFKVRSDVPYLYIYTYIAL